MADSLAQFFVTALEGKVSSEIIAFIVSLMPILELRGGLIAAKLMDIEFIRAFIICYIGNILPIPFILLFIRKIFNLLKRNERIGGIIGRLEEKSLAKADKVRKYRLWGLFIFVAIPLPGTGAWTGALIADLLDIRIRDAMLTIGAGVLVAGGIISALSYGLFGLLGF
ncbi:MAG: small multi-drug export protein [Ruminococcaceae bacterium]|nr:small multi-drug export protein [Oscillospiraceae bacterium]